jgi:hypothetical protein
MGKVGRKLGFIIGCLLGIVGGGLNTLSVYLSSLKLPLGLYFAILCLGSLFLGFSNGFAGFYRFAAADVVTKRKSIAIAVVLMGKIIQILNYLIQITGGDAAALLGPRIATWTRVKIKK